MIFTGLQWYIGDNCLYIKTTYKKQNQLFSFNIIKNVVHICPQFTVAVILILHKHELRQICMTICKKCTQTNVHTSFNIIKYMQFDVWGMKSETAVKHNLSKMQIDEE